jgi:hypothetical protein
VRHGQGPFRDLVAPKQQANQSYQRRKAQPMGNRRVLGKKEQWKGLYDEFNNYGFSAGNSVATAIHWFRW